MEPFTPKSEKSVRLLILSDTHCALPSPSDSNDAFRWPLPRADVCIHAGDLTMNGKLEQHEKALQLIKGINAELKIVIPGNHDLTLHKEYYNQFWYLHSPPTKYSSDSLDQIEDLYTNDAARQSGIVYLTEGVRTFNLSNGSTFCVYVSAWQPEFYNWAFGYPRDQDRYNATTSDARWQPPNPVPDAGIDIMITHGPPAGILDQTHRGEHVGCGHLRRAAERCKPRLHVFGHIHESWGVLRKQWSNLSDGTQERPYPEQSAQVDLVGAAYYDASDLEAGKETLFVNASVMNVVYSPLQSPWVVDMMLPSSVQSGKEPISAYKPLQGEFDQAKYKVLSIAFVYDINDPEYPQDQLVEYIVTHTAWCIKRDASSSWIP